MTQPPTMGNPKLFRRVICFSLTVSLLIVLGSSGLADYTPSDASDRPSDNIRNTVGGSRAYTPPPTSRTSGEDHTGGGVRGCGDNIATLAPRLNFVGQSSTTRPTFVWYMFGEAAEPLEFHLYHYQADGSLEAVLIDPIGSSTQGYMAYTLPSGQPDLTVGETYLWQVVLYCDPNLEEVGRWASADVEIVALPADLMAGLPEGTLPQAQAYARAGLWYEAMAAVYDATTPEEKAFRQDLLLDLADLEEQSEQESIINLSSQLRQIAEMP
ncbi:MAG: DUF928 domain-containing protein [Leptolyngbya sp. SIO1E4]|nr:DUF928 domain-containing protein [Leptolyngbya sp. SIO1E4]